MRTQFSLIAVVGSPLLLSFDMSNWTKPWSGPAGSIDLVTLYSNPEVLAVHQALDANGGLTYARIAGGPTTTDGIMPGMLLSILTLALTTHVCSYWCDMFLTFVAHFRWGHG